MTRISTGVSTAVRSTATFPADAERLATIERRTPGNWSLGQIVKHPAKSLDMMIDGPQFWSPCGR
jgi:hypothetical protein